MKQAAGNLSLAACAGMFVFGLANALLGAVLPLLATRLNFDLAQSGKLFLILNFGVLLCVVGMGPLMDRYGMKAAMVAGPLLVAVAMIGIAQAASYLWLAAACFLLGLGGGALNSATNTLVADLHSDPKRKNSALTFLGVFFGAGALLVPLGLGSLLESAGLGPILFAAAVICVVAGLYPATLPFPIAKYSGNLPTARLAQFLGDRSVWVFAAMVFLQSGNEIVLAGYVTTYLTTFLGASVSKASWLLTALWASVIVARLLLAKLLLRASGGHVVLWSALVSSAGAASFLLAATHTQALTALVVTGAGLAGVFPTVMGMAGARFHDHSGAVFGILLTMGRLGAMTLPYLTGMVAGEVGLRAAMAILVVNGLIIAGLQAGVRLSATNPTA
ncbi:MAG: MFS transporter [Acidobacteriia bacterium]|nr:MFS transporter [Terriglobia bacterium]